MRLRKSVRFPKSLLLVILFGFALRLASIDFQSLWRDEVDSAGYGDPRLRLGDVLATGDFDRLKGVFTQPGLNGPLYYLALQQWTHLASDTGFALRFPSAFFGTLVIPLTYVVAKRLLSTRTQRNTDEHRSDSRSVSSVQIHVPSLAAWLVAISPYFVWYSQEAKMYTETAALALVAIYALRRATAPPVSPSQSRGSARGGKWWTLVIVATTVAIYSHILAALLIGVEVVLFLLWWPYSKPHVRGGLIALAALTLPYLPLAVWQIKLAITPGDQGHTFYAFDAMLRVMMVGFANGVLPFDATLNALGIRLPAEAIPPALNPSSWGAWLLGLLAVIGTLMWKDAADRGNRLGLAAWVILPTASVALVSLNRPVFSDRYLIWIGPAVYVLAALGISEVWMWRRVAGGAAIALVSLIAVLGVIAQAITPFKPDFRSAASFVAARYRGEAIVFQIPYGRYNFDYYFAPPFRMIDGPYTNHRNADGTYLNDTATSEAHIAAALSGQTAVWLVASEVETWDDRHLLEDWLKRYARETDRGEFMRVAVVRYEIQVDK